MQHPTVLIGPPPCFGEHFSRADAAGRIADDDGRRPPRPVGLDDSDPIRDPLPHRLIGEHPWIDAVVEGEPDGVLQTRNRAALPEEVGRVSR